MVFLVAAVLVGQTALPKPAAEVNKGKRHALVKSTKPAAEEEPKASAVAKKTTGKAKPAAKPAAKRAKASA